MTIALVQDIAATNAGTYQLAQSVTVSAGNTLVIFLLGAIAGRTITVSDNHSGGSNTYLVSGTYTDGYGSAVKVYVVESCVGGTYTIVFTDTAFGSDITNLLIREYSGTSGIGCYLGGAGTAFVGSGSNAADSVSTGNINVTVAPAMLSGVCIDTNGNGVASAGTGFTGSTIWGALTVAEQKRVTSSGNTPLTWTPGAVYDTYLVGGVAIAESTGSIGTAALSLNGAQAGVMTNTFLAGAVGALALVGNAPIVISGPPSIIPATASLSFSGYAPIQTLGVPGPYHASLGLSGFAPTVKVVSGLSIQPPAGTLSVSTYGPTIAVTTQAGTARLSLVGSAPVVGQTGSAILLHPPAAALGLSGSPPSIGFSYAVTPHTGALALSGQSVNAGGSYTIFGGTGSLSLTGQTAQTLLATTLMPGAGALNLAGAAPQALTPAKITTRTGALSLSGSAPRRLMATLMTPSSGALTFASIAPKPLINLMFGPIKGALSLQGYAPSIGLTQNLVISAGTAKLVTQGLPPNFFFTTLIPDEGALVLVAPYKPGYSRGNTPYAEYTAEAGDKILMGVSWDQWLTNLWSGSSAVASDFAIRPKFMDGYEFVCTQAGVTGTNEPRWFAYPGAVIDDGSAQWTCQNVSNDSLSATLTSTAWTGPTPGPLLTSVTVINQRSDCKVDTTGLAAGGYSIRSVAVFSDGTTKAAVILLKVAA